MEVLWYYPGPVRAKELFDTINSHGKDWKRQTLNSLLGRLEEKKTVKRNHVYAEAVSSEMELLKMQTHQILVISYTGKYADFIAALTPNT